MLVFLVIASCVLIAEGQVTNTTNVNRCASNLGDLPLHVYIEGCIDPPCEIPVGGNVVVHVVFRSTETIRSMKTIANAMGFINYPLGENAVTCNFLTNTYCPILKDEVVSYTLRMSVPAFSPIPIDIVFRVEDENNKTPVWCFSTVIQTVRQAG